MAEPTEQERANAALRAEIARRQQAEYDECLRWALEALGPGWRPSHRHFLVDRDEEERARQTGEPMQAAATVYTARNSAGEVRHFTVKDGKAVESPPHKEAFGAMLFEPHPTRGFTGRDGQWHPVHHYGLYWAGYEPDYHPKTAEQLAAARERRETRAVEKAAEEHPLFADLIRSGQLTPDRPKRQR